MILPAVGIHLPFDSYKSWNRPAWTTDLSDLRFQTKSIAYRDDTWNSMQPPRACSQKRHPPDLVAEHEGRGSNPLLREYPLHLELQACGFRDHPLYVHCLPMERSYVPA
jgi:hypothetical protein